MSKRKLYIIPSFLLIILLLSCERTGYYDEGEKNIVNTLTDKNWERSYKFRNDGTGEEYEMLEIFFFKKDGSCIQKNISTDSNGETEESISYPQWAFITQNFSVIYFNSNVYWEISKLTENELSVAETYRDYTIRDQPRYYKTFVPKQTD